MDIDIKIDAEIDSKKDPIVGVDVAELSIRIGDIEVESVHSDGCNVGRFNNRIVDDIGGCGECNRV